MEVTDTDRADDSMLQQQLHGDMLECVLLRVPPDELTASAALVSSEWRRAARAVHQRQRQRHRGAVVSLVAHIQGASVGRSTHVYDPRSRTWASDDKMAPAHLQVLPVRRCACAGGDRVYTLSLASMTLSVDALGTAWRELPPPCVWRVDPVVAAVGARVVLLGGACGAMASAGVVEVVNHEHAESGWAMCAPMPAPLACASSGRWVSAAASERRVYVVERRTGWASWFDPSARQWGPTRRLQQPDTDTDTASDVVVDTGMIRSWATCGVSRGGERLLILLATGSCSSDGLRVVLWSVDGETLLAREDEQGTMAEMPAEMSEKLFGGGLRTAAASIINIGAVAGSSSGGYYCGGYVYNASEPNNGAVMYELEGDDHELGVVGGKKKNNETTMKKKTSSIGSSSNRWEWLPCPPTAAAAQESDPFLGIVFGSAASQN